MMKIKYISAEQFNDFSSQQKNCSIFQSVSWTKTKSNWKPFYFGFSIHSNIEIACMFLLRKLPAGFHFAYAPRGPVSSVSAIDNPELYIQFLQGIQHELAKHKVVLAKIDPNIVIEQVEFSDKKKVQTLQSEHIISIFKKAGLHHTGYPLSLHKTIQPRIQLGFPITPTFEDRISSKTMKKVRASLKKGVTIQIEYTSDSLVKMVQCTEQRHNIHLRNASYFNQILEAFQHNACVLACYHEDILLSACLLVKCASTTEILYSGYDDNYKQFNSTYPLRYYSILWAKENGCETFNFGGVEGTLDDGLTMFKSSFNPCIDVYIGEFDLLPLPVISPVVRLAYPLLKKIAL